MVIGYYGKTPKDPNNERQDRQSVVWGLAPYSSMLLISVNTLAVSAQPSVVKQKPSTQLIQNAGTWREECAEERRRARLAVRVAETVHVHRQDAARAQDLRASAMAASV